MNNFKSITKQFNKRFASGEQNIRIIRKEEGVYIIEEEPKDYYWQENVIYNRLTPIVELFKLKYNLKEKDLYGKGGIVEILIPFQVRYNKIKNRTMECIELMCKPVMCVEDGSIDVEALEEEGLAPGKVILYRQGSNPPINIEPNTIKKDNNVVSFFLELEQSTLIEFNNMVETLREVYKDKLKNKDKNNIGFLNTH